MSESDSKLLFKVLEDGALYDLREEEAELGHSINDAYIKEMEHFFNLIGNKDIFHDLDINSGIKVLECIHSSKIKDWQT